MQAQFLSLSCPSASLGEPGMKLERLRLRFQVNGLSTKLVVRAECKGLVAYWVIEGMGAREGDMAVSSEVNISGYLLLLGQAEALSQKSLEGI